VTETVTTIPPIRVLVADDHPIVREGIVSVLRGERDLDVVGEAGDGKETVALVERLRPDVVILDVSMPRLNGVTAAWQIAKVAPAVRIIILTVHADQAYVTQALAAGVRGYVLKQAVTAELAKAIRLVQSGQVFLSPEISGGTAPGSLGQPAAREPDAPIDELTLREVEVLQLIAEGCSSKEIAQLLALSVKTIETHRSRLMAKLNIHETAGLVRYAIRKRIVQP
jgi:two-component system response regulator NreC